MTDLPRSIGRLLIAAALLAIVGAGQSARAQQIDDDEEEAPAQPVMRGGFNAFVMNDAQFDQWVFGNMGVANAGVARNKLDSLLTLHVDDLERTCGLTPVQKKKLLLAGRGDIKRFFDRIDDLRKKFDQEQERSEPVRADLAGDPAAAERVQRGLLRRGVDLRQGDQGDPDPGAGGPARGGGPRSDRSIDTGPGWTWRWSSEQRGRIHRRAAAAAREAADRGDEAAPEAGRERLLRRPLPAEPDPRGEDQADLRRCPVAVASSGSSIRAGGWGCSSSRMGSCPTKGRTKPGVPKPPSAAAMKIMPAVPSGTRGPRAERGHSMAMTRASRSGGRRRGERRHRAGWPAARRPP